MRKYCVYGNDLDTLTMEKAKEVELECEEYSMEVSKKVGMWEPTRQLALDAQRLACDLSDKAKTSANVAYLLASVALSLSVVAIILVLSLL